MAEGRNNEAAVAIANANHEDEERAGGFKYIPEEIVLNILPNLPMCSLLRFRCVSKQWSFQISPGIITKVHKVLVPGNQPFVFKSIDQNAHVEDIEIEVDKAITTGQPDDFPGIYGSCNGFLLIRVGMNLFLWNPSTRRSYGMLTYLLLAEYPLGRVISGLCFDSNYNEYKVVLGLNHRDWRQRSVRVGSFKTKSWSTVADFPYNASHFNSGPTLNNCLHWWSTNAILCFDPKLNKFINISLPKEFVEYRHRIIRLAVLDGYLCMDHGRAVFGRKQFGVKESWKIMFQFSNMEYNYERRKVGFSHMAPLFFTDEQKRRVLIHGRRTAHERYYHMPGRLLSDEYVVLAYDIENGQSSDITVLDYAECPHDGVAVYEETVVRPVSMRNEPTTSDNLNRSEEVPFGGKKVWKVKEGETKAAKIVIQEDKKVTTGVEEWEELRKAWGKETSSSRCLLSNAFDLRNG